MNRVYLHRRIIIMSSRVRYRLACPKRSCAPFTSLSRAFDGRSIDYVSPDGTFGVTKLRVTGVMATGRSVEDDVSHTVGVGRMYSIGPFKIVTAVTTCGRKRR